MKIPHLKKVLIPFVALMLVVGVCIYFVFAPVMTQQGSMIFYLRPGTSKKVIGAELLQQGVISSSTTFSFYMLLHKNAELKSGEYLFPAGSSVHSIWKQITSGTGLYYRPFTIVPGWTFKQLRNQLAQIDGLKHFTANMTDQQIMALFGAPTVSPEGEFYPETYNYTKGDLDITILKRAYNLMQLRLSEAWEQRANGLPYKDMYTALIVASIIEREAYLDAERPVIAGVIINRLHQGMLLQIDATVIYGLGDRYDGKIYKKDLLENTPYNTYVQKGLPPTPISMPGMASINAALHPVITSYLYYVAKGDGSHQFSTSLSQHKAAVEKSLHSSSPAPALQNKAKTSSIIKKIVKVSA